MGRRGNSYIEEIERVGFGLIQPRDDQRHGAVAAGVVSGILSKKGLLGKTRKSQSLIEILTAILQGYWGQLAPGSIKFEGEKTTQWPANRLVGKGIAYIAEDRVLFATDDRVRESKTGCL